jgi:hypothetical protein
MGLFLIFPKLLTNFHTQDAREPEETEGNCCAKSFSLHKMHLDFGRKENFGRANFNSNDFYIRKHFGPSLESNGWFIRNP